MVGHENLPQVFDVRQDGGWQGEDHHKVCSH